MDKPPGMTSHTVVAQIRRRLGVRRVGHAGTLDPAATGVMVVGAGAGTRLLTYLVGLPKTYRATMRLGVATTTEDADGEVVSAPGCHPATDPAAALAQLTGAIQQRPSAVSAVKVAGQRAYDRVRRGEHVELPPREVHVDRFVVLGRRTTTAAGVPVLDLDVEVGVSSGTYVRALARDLGELLGTVGHVTALQRTTVGPFPLADTVALDDIDVGALRSLGSVAAAVLPTRVIDPGNERSVTLGQRIPAEAAPREPVALLDRHGHLLAVAGIEEGRYRYAMVVPGEALPEAAGGSGTLERP